jgi:hypothetical protein
MIIIVLFIIALVVGIPVICYGLFGKHPHGNRRQQPPRTYHEDTGEFSQEELDYWYLNQQNDED